MEQKNNNTINAADNKTASTMQNVGRAGLIATGGVGLAAGIQAGRTASALSGVAKDVSEVMKLRNDPKFSKVVKEGIVSATKDTPISSKFIIDKLGQAKKIYNNTKFSKIDRMSKAYNALNTISNQNRTILVNAEDWARLGADKIKPQLNAESRVLVDKGVSNIGRLAKAGLRWKNAKLLGRIGLGLGAISGASYLHGKELQSYNDQIRRFGEENKNKGQGKV